jgi:hypothetical protein
MSLALLLALPAVAEEAGGEMTAKPATPATMSEQFFTRIVAGEISPAFDELFTGSAIAVDRKEPLERIKQQSEAALPLYGKLYDWELLRDEACADGLTRQVYFLRTEKLPLIWQLFFYRPPGGDWVAVSVTFSDEPRHITPICPLRSAGAP